MTTEATPEAMTVIHPPEALVRRQARAEVRERIADRADFPSTSDGLLYRIAYREVIRDLDELDRADGFEVPESHYRYPGHVAQESTDL